MKKIKLSVMVLSIFLPVLSFAVEKDCLKNKVDTPICTGDRVIDTGNYAGQVHAVFSNGHTKVKFDNISGLHDRNIEVLSKAVQCYGRVCENGRVIDTGNYAGTVEMVFESGQTKVKLDNIHGLRDRNANDLSLGAVEVGEFRVNDRVIDTGNYMGTVVMLFENGKTKVKLDNIHGLRDRNVRDLAKLVHCSS